MYVILQSMISYFKSHWFSHFEGEIIPCADYLYYECPIDRCDVVQDWWGGE